MEFQIDPHRPSFKDLNSELGQIGDALRLEEALELEKKLQKEECVSKLKAENLYIETPVRNGN